ncbi:unnamed protein product [Prorocentrum cordatum]|uniref:Uncharacterized protein n=1 Tax=Prorocentrum cordatum TaxID=2364126 RepID=A0ABN9VDX8_9DINO|nr:unnamed protein product [Polarella glacialis]
MILSCYLGWPGTSTTNSSTRPTGWQCEWIQQRDLVEHVGRMTDSSACITWLNSTSMAWLSSAASLAIVGDDRDAQHDLVKFGPQTSLQRRKEADCTGCI